VASSRRDNTTTQVSNTAPLCAGDRPVRNGSHPPTQRRASADLALAHPTLPLAAATSTCCCWLRLHHTCCMPRPDLGSSTLHHRAPVILAEAADPCATARGWATC
jgi:hypothetical protein